ncbi:4-(cytidine 5'-diphospho)-2-C-methyl-D-erythritol kinase [Aquamicrobium segne]|uniref:4-diphosphocytidyl-2-C-methyl-D-erythritol kinase n=1 Tax=Aquamicrobium segne TaxID=469547 RepID=A0ABW0GVU2_9HYPH
MDTVVTLVEAAPAKLNLALHVVGRRLDGYHKLETLVVFTDYGDHLRLTPAPADHFSIHGPYARGLPVDAKNLVIGARESLRQMSKQTNLFPVAIRLEKNLPIASGIGGGSSNAAAILRALARYWQIDDSKIIAAIALQLGADVPMCLAARPLLAQGIGERIKPVCGLPKLFVVLVNPGVEISTPQVFSNLASRQNPPLQTLPDPVDFSSLLGWLAASRNDLETAALAIAPVIAQSLAALRANNASFVRMSGSGATCFGLYESETAAKIAAQTIQRAQPDWFVTATSTTE